MELVHPAPNRQPRPAPPSAGLVVLQAASIEMAPRRLLDTLRQLGALRIVLVGPEFGSLAYRLALDLGFDEVWPAALPAPTVDALLARAWAAPAVPDRGSASAPSASASASASAPASVPGPAPTGASVDLSGGTCTMHGRVIAMPHECLRLLAGLLAAYPATAPRAGLAAPAPLHGRRIDMTVSRLRATLRAAGIDHLHVQAVRGVGYRLLAGVALA